MTDQLTTASELLRLLEIEFDERSPTRVVGSVGADKRHHQPWGLVHGGLYTTVVETFATIRRPEDGKLIARGQVRLQNIEARR